MSWSIHRSDSGSTALDVTSHHPPRAHFLFMFQAILLAFQNFMGPSRKEFPTPEATPDRWERSFDTQALHVMLQLIRSDKFPASPFARYESFGAFVLLVDLLPARSISVKNGLKIEKETPHVHHSRRRLISRK